MYSRNNRAAIAAEIDDISRGDWIREMNKRDHESDLKKLYYRLWSDGESLDESREIMVEYSRYSSIIGEDWEEEIFPIDGIEELARDLWLNTQYKSMCTGYAGYGSHFVIFSK